MPRRSATAATVRPMNIHSLVPLSRAERVNVRTAWSYEDRHFTPWLAENLDWLEIPMLGPLRKTGVEVRLPGTDRALDIQAETIDGRIVAIENQYGGADHDHLTRGLAYAVGLRASALVIIAEEHRGEFVAVADYLNRAAEAVASRQTGLDSTGSGPPGGEQPIAMFLVTLMLERVGETYCPRFEVTAAPNWWRATAVRSSARGAVRSVDEFLASVDSSARLRIDEILRLWQEIPGARVSPAGGINTVALYVPTSRTSEQTPCAFGLERTGVVWFYRQYVVSRDPFKSSALLQQELDRLVAEQLGDVSYGEKRGWGKAAEAKPAGIAAVGHWIAQADAEPDGTGGPDEPIGSDRGPIPRTVIE